MLSQAVFPVSIPTVATSMHADTAERKAYRAYCDAKNAAERAADRARRAFVKQLEADGFAVYHYGWKGANVSRDGRGVAVEHTFDFAQNAWVITIAGDASILTA